MSWPKDVRPTLAVLKERGLIRYRVSDDGLVKIARESGHHNPAVVVLNPDGLGWFDVRTPDERQQGFLRLCLHLGLDEATIYQAIGATEQLEARL